MQIQLSVTSDFVCPWCYIGEKRLARAIESLPTGIDVQLQWLASDLASIPPDVPLVVLAHRPLFPLFPEWEWATKDGDRAIEILSKRRNVTVFYGHIHQEHHFATGNIAHHAARSLVFPLPAPGSVPKKAPLPWDPASADHGLGWRSVALGGANPRLTEVPYRIVALGETRAGLTELVSR